ncbi:MAG: YdcF family protein [Nostoc sp.]|uniref:YdcF family protein n=1 Tax=Nostoc sp. TaxID=1180 RepID=UPI002FF96F01
MKNRKHGLRKNHSQEKLRFYFKRKQGQLTLVLIALLILISIIPVRLAVALHLAPIPQAIFVLGSDSERMEFAGRFWQSHKNLDIWVSDYASYLEINRRIFQRFNIPERQLHLDGRATDTVTNFTSLVEDFVAQKFNHIYLITSDYHMSRAKAIASIVLGSRGIIVSPLVVPSRGFEFESRVHILRDCVRSVIWIATGRTGASFNPQIKSNKFI